MLLASAPASLLRCHCDFLLVDGGPLFSMMLRPHIVLCGRSFGRSLYVTILHSPGTSIFLHLEIEFGVTRYV